MMQRATRFTMRTVRVTHRVGTSLRSAAIPLQGGIYQYRWQYHDRCNLNESITCESTWLNWNCVFAYLFDLPLVANANARDRRNSCMLHYKNNCFCKHCRSNNNNFILFHYIIMLMYSMLYYNSMSLDRIRNDVDNGRLSKTDNGIWKREY